MEVFEKHVFVCTSGKTCPLKGSEELCSRLRQEIAERGLKGKIRINKAGCFDQCQAGPLVVVYPESIWYANVSPDDAEEILQSHLLGDKPVQRLLYKKED